MKTISQSFSGFIKPSSVLLLVISFSLLPLGCKPKLKTETFDEVEGDNWSDLVEPVSQSGVPGGVAVPYPLEKTIRNAAGQELKGAILAKRGDDILFQRSIDSNEFVVSLHNLNIDDRLELVQLPDGLEEKIDSIKLPESVAVATTKDSRLAIGADLPSYANFDEAKEAAEISGKPILIILTGTPIEDPDELDDVKADAAKKKATRASQGFIRTILTDGSFKRFVHENFEFIHINYLGSDVITAEDRKTQQQVGGASGIFNYPAAVVLQANGYELAQFGDFGTRGPRPLIERLENILKDR